MEGNRVLPQFRSSFGDVRKLIALVWTDASAYVRHRLALVLFLVAAAAAITAMAPVFLKWVVDGFAVKNSASAAIYAFAILFAVSQWLAHIAGEFRNLVHARVERRMFSALSERVFTHLMRLPLSFHSNRRTGGINQTLENGLQGYQIVMHHMVFTILPVIVELGGTLLILARLQHGVILVLFSLALLSYGTAFVYAAVAITQRAERASAAAVNSTAAMTDPLLNVEAIKHFTAEFYVLNKVRSALSRTESEWVGFYRRYARNGIVAGTIFASFRALTLVYAAHEVQFGRMSVGEFVLVNTYIAQMVQPVQMLGYAMQGLSQGSAMLKQLLTLLGERPEEYLPDDGRPLGGKGRLEFRRVAASYGPDREVLRDVSFTLEPGKTLGIVGASGSGKSTIIRLMMRTLEPTGGQVLIDGIPMQTLPLTKLRRSIGLVAQETSLLNDTISANIALGNPEACRGDIESAARAARLHDFILSLPDGYDTQIGERGFKLSGGERQRIAIARAILKNPRMFVFDEATSSLDSKNERAILDSLIEVSKHRTAVIVAHRLSTVAHADEIVVLDAGCIVERGTHTGLLAAEGKYAALWRAQHQRFGEPRTRVSERPGAAGQKGTVAL